MFTPSNKEYTHCSIGIHLQLLCSANRLKNDVNTVKITYFLSKITGLKLFIKAVRFPDNDF